MQILPDFSEEVGFTPVAPGVYKVRVIDSEVRDSKAGNKYVSWKLQIFGAEGDMAKANNRTLFGMSMVSGKAAGQIKEFAKACGKEITGAFDTEMFHGCELQAMVEMRIDNNGQEQNNIRRYMPLA